MPALHATPRLSFPDIITPYTMPTPTPQHVEVTRVPGSAIVPSSLNPATGPHMGISKLRFTLAFIIAVTSDAASVAAQVAPPVQWVIDGVTALLLFLILGRRWQILPALIAEAVPALGALPFWVLVVLAVFASDVKARRTSNRSTPHVVP